MHVSRIWKSQLDPAHHSSHRLLPWDLNMKKIMKKGLDVILNKLTIEENLEININMKYFTNLHTLSLHLLQSHIFEWSQFLFYLRHCVFMVKRKRRRLTKKIKKVVYWFALKVQIKRNCNHVFKELTKSIWNPKSRERSLQKHWCMRHHSWNKNEVLQYLFFWDIQYRQISTHPLLLVKLETPL